MKKYVSKKKDPLEISKTPFQVLAGIMASLSTLAIFVVTKAFPSILSSAIGAPGAYWWVGLELMEDVCLGQNDGC